MTTSEFEKDYLPISCVQCGQQGFIFINDFERSYFVICKTCGWETSQVWCPKCQMGGEFVSNILDRPFSWNCPQCNTRYELSSAFYELPVMLFAKEALPPATLERIEKDFQSSNSLWRTLRSTIIALVAIAVLMAVAMLPMLLVYTPLPWTIPGFIATLLIFAVWWWLIGRVLKLRRDPLAESDS
jgi:hypothetical protein